MKHDLRPAEGATQKAQASRSWHWVRQGQNQWPRPEGAKFPHRRWRTRQLRGRSVALTKRLPKAARLQQPLQSLLCAGQPRSDRRLFGAQSEVSQASLASVGLLGDVTDPVVVLARGEVTKPLTVKVQRISAIAKQKIEAAGGSVEVLGFEVNKRPRS
jgi:large subunit ribosomal protein L15